MNNLIFDYSNKIQIPQNEKRNFEIKAYAEWKYSLSISFKIEEELNKLNLYFILKSYIKNTNFPPYMLATSFKKENINIITSKNNINWYKNMDYYSFCEWITYRLTKDSDYKINDKFYNILLIYSPSLFEIEIKTVKTKNLLNILKPLYPWSPEWLNEHEKELDKIQLLKEKIKFYENLIKHDKK